MPEPRFDYVIVGGGTAGCVLASRLSERPHNRVLLIEAGRDIPPGDVPDDILHDRPRPAYANPDYFWNDLRVRFCAAPHDHAGPIPDAGYLQARIMGGGSSINDMQAIRGTPDDYDGWSRMGAAGWSWADVLPYFRRVERDLDFSGDLHGQDGRIPISRIDTGDWPGFALAARDAFSSAGYESLEDQNAQFGDGHFPIAVCSDAGNRVSAATAYLDTQVRERPNLEIWADSQVLRIALDGRRASGVEVRRNGADRRVDAAHTVVCAGAIHSPSLLMRSGVGPGAVLRKAGVAVVADLPGVGANLQDHAAIAACAFLPRPARLAADMQRPTHVAMRYSSGLPGCPAQDMYMVAVSRAGRHPAGLCFGGLRTWLNKPYSRGTVALASPEPLSAPDVTFNLLADDRDAERLKQGLALIARLFDQPAMRRAVRDPFPEGFSHRMRALAREGVRDRIATRMTAVLLSGPPPLRRALVSTLRDGGASLDSLLRHEDGLDRFVRERTQGVRHACGTCRIGPEDDRQAVVDPKGRVHQVEGLSVADASVMPSVPRANTNLPVLMIAEKLSDALLDA